MAGNYNKLLAAGNSRQFTFTNLPIHQFTFKLFAVLLLILEIFLADGKKGSRLHISLMMTELSSLRNSFQLSYKKFYHIFYQKLQQKFN